MNKTKAVMDHLLENGSINTWEAIRLYGATRLSAIIYNLRKYGMNIKNERVQTIDKYGRKIHYDEYVYVGEE